MPQPHYLSGYSTRQTPQSEAIPGTSQVPNSAGGHSWAVDDWTRLRRFLILGASGGSYYASERALVCENADAVGRCLAADGPRTVSEIVAVSDAGRAPKNDPAIFALAMACAAKDDATRLLALTAVPRVCRTGTHLFHFCEFVGQFRGWGRGLRRAVAAWYEEKDPDALAYQLVKYRQRDGWSHNDVLSKVHPSPPSPAHQAMFARVVPKERPMTNEDRARKYSMHGDALPDAFAAYLAAQTATGPQNIVSLIETFGDKLPREAIPPEHLSRDVWDALLGAGMPMTALIRNLPTMTRCGLLTPTSEATRAVVAQIGDGDRIRGARVHPIAVLAAMLTYAAGRSVRGSAEWAPVPQIVDAFDGAFYASFGNVEATGKRWLIGLDVSGSMDSGVVAGVPGLTPRVASSAMAMVTMATGDPYDVVAFTSGGYYGGGRPGLTVLPFSARQRLDDICRATSGLPFGATDCALPMLYATQENRAVDCFVIFTDSETWAGNVHPSQALAEYRRRSGIPARLAVVGMVSNGFSIADPDDAGMMDFVGFDTSTPTVMRDFALGEV